MAGFVVHGHILINVWILYIEYISKIMYWLFKMENIQKEQNHITVMRIIIKSNENFKGKCA